MTSSYGELRDSGIAWIARVPAHWETTQFRAVFEPRRVKNTGMAESNLLSLSHGRVIRRNIDSPDGLVPGSYETYQIVERNDVVFRFTDLQNDKKSLRSARVTERGIITSAYVAVKPVGIDARYADYLMRSYDLSKVFYGLGGGVRQSLKFSDVALLPVLLPTKVEQSTIAAYLDRETRRIDELIKEQQGLITSLRERRAAVIDSSVAVATGDRVRLRFLFSPSDVRNRPDERVLSVYREYGVIPKDSRDDNFNQTPENVERYLLVRPGDLVVNKMKAWQGSLGVSKYRGIVSGDYEVLRPTTERLLPEFAHSYLRSARMVAEYAVRSKGIRPSQWRLYWRELADVEVPTPPIAEQERIVQIIATETARIDELISESDALIALSRERRGAIITAAVTGQIDVQKAA